MISKEKYRQRLKSTEVIKVLDKKEYTNGQQRFTLKHNWLTFYYKNGMLKAEGEFANERMEGEWKFYRESGQLWQVGHFLAGKKEGSWVRYARDGQVEVAQVFQEDKLVKKNKTEL